MLLLTSVMGFWSSWGTLLFSDFMPISTAAKKNFKSCDIWRQINFSNQIKPEALTTEECALNVVTEQKGGGLFKKKKKKWLGFLFFLFFCIAYDAVENWKPERKRFQRMNLSKSFGSPFFQVSFSADYSPTELQRLLCLQNNDRNFETVLTRRKKKRREREPFFSWPLHSVLEHQCLSSTAQADRVSHYWINISETQYWLLVIWV